MNLLVIDQPALLKIAKTLNCTGNSEVTLCFESDGVTTRFMDASHVTMVDARLTYQIFEKYEIDADFKATLDPEQFSKIVQKLDKGAVNLRFLQDKIVISQNGFSLDFSLREIGMTDCPLPRIPFDIEADFQSTQFKGIISKIGTVSDYVNFDTNESRIIVSGKGDNGSSELSLSKNDAVYLVREDSNTTYSLEYIKSFLKTLDKTSPLKFQYSSNKPARFQTKINNLGIVDYYLAPRIEN